MYQAPGQSKANTQQILGLFIQQLQLQICQCCHGSVHVLHPQLQLSGNWQLLRRGASERDPKLHRDCRNNSTYTNAPQWHLPRRQPAFAIQQLHRNLRPKSAHYVCRISGRLHHPNRSLLTPNAAGTAKRLHYLLRYRGEQISLLQAALLRSCYLDAGRQDKAARDWVGSRWHLRLRQRRTISPGPLRSSLEVSRSYFCFNFPILTVSQTRISRTIEATVSPLVGLQHRSLPWPRWTSRTLLQAISRSLFSQTLAMASICITMPLVPTMLSILSWILIVWWALEQRRGLWVENHVCLS